MGAVIEGIADLIGLTPDAPNVNIHVPGPTPTEQELLNLQTQYIRQALAPPTEEEQQLQDRMVEYYEQMLSENVLSVEEEAEFEEEYNLQLEAMQEQFGMETERFGAQRMSELVSRGVWETTTGEDIMARDQQQYAGILSENVAQLGEAREIAKSDMELAKQQMAQQGYQLTSGLLQARQSDALSAAANMQNYLTSQNMMTANSALQSAMMQQQWGQHQYNQQMGGSSFMMGMGTNLLMGAL